MCMFHEATRLNQYHAKQGKKADAERQTQYSIMDIRSWGLQWLPGGWMVGIREEGQKAQSSIKTEGMDSGNKGYSKMIPVKSNVL